MVQCDMQLLITKSCMKLTLIIKKKREFPFIFQLEVTYKDQKCCIEKSIATAVYIMFVIECRYIHLIDSKFTGKTSARFILLNNEVTDGVKLLSTNAMAHHFL